MFIRSDVEQAFQSCPPVVRIPATLTDVRTSMESGQYREELYEAIKVALAVVASLSLKNRDNCLVVVFEGGSGQGKSVVLRMLYPNREGTKKHVVRVDDFTPASFVSHAANRTRKALEAIDLLPQVKGKAMLTKELAPLFRDEEKQLRKNFARLTAVLDGEGYKSHSGTQGGRGYEGRYIFNWIGATTPIPPHTHRVMAQLGNRILFYEVAGEEPTEEELMDFAENYETNDAIEECKGAVNDFIEKHFAKYPAESLDPESIYIPEEIVRHLVRYSKLIAKGRVEIFGENGVYEAATPEGPQRVILLLQMLARGLALADQRNEVAKEDLRTIRHVAFSSIPGKRRELLRALLAAGGRMKSGDVSEALGVTKPTALARMHELAATGICEFVPGCEKTPKAAELYLAKDFNWLL